MPHLLSASVELAVGCLCLAAAYAVTRRGRRALGALIAVAGAAAVAHAIGWSLT